MKYILLIIQSIRFMPHIIALLLFPARLRPDLMCWMRVIDNNPYKGSILASYCWLLINLREYRTLVYYRLGMLGGLLRLFASPMPACYLTGTLSRNIGEGLIIHHGHSMRLGAQRVGKNVQLWHNVTVGKSHPGGALPIIGDNVCIFTGSVVLGNITIGNDVTIGACTIVLKSVPDGCVVVGNPARIIKRGGVACDIPL